MKQEDFDRLKAVCEKEGFVLSTGGIIPGSSMLVEVYKKDPWDGVEFAEYIGHPWPTGQKIFKVLSIDNFDVINVIDGSIEGGHLQKDNCKPSTESAYIEQLKKECFERFGDIKEWDRFDLTPISRNSSDNWATYPNKPDFEYRKDIDRLLAKGITIYQSGKWATRVKERVDVTFSMAESCDNSFKVYFNVDNAKKIMENYKGGDAGRFLASQLEKYLNGEIE